jgi:hypothetical protein
MPTDDDAPGRPLITPDPVVPARALEPVGDTPRASMAQLKAKPQAEQEYITVVGGQRVSFKYRAIGARDYDRLVTANPPTAQQRADGASFDINKFAPALLARVIVDPVANESDWSDIWLSGSWNRGECMDLFMTAVNLCNQGLDITPFGSGSE